MTLEENMRIVADACEAADKEDGDGAGILLLSMSIIAALFELDGKVDRVLAALEAMKPKPQESAEPPGMTEEAFIKRAKQLLRQALDPKYPETFLGAIEQLRKDLGNSSRVEVFRAQLCVRAIGDGWKYEYQANSPVELHDE